MKTIATILTASSVFLLALLVKNAEASYTGQATYYYQGGSYGSCGSISSDSEYICALSASLQGASKAQCGKCVKITGPNKNSITVRVVDTCPECASGSIDLSTAAFSALSDMSAGRIAISWDFVDCSTGASTGTSSSAAVVSQASTNSVASNSGNVATSSSTSSSSPSSSPKTLSASSSSSSTSGTSATSSNQSSSSTSTAVVASNMAATSTPETSEAAVDNTNKSDVLSNNVVVNSTLNSEKLGSKKHVLPNRIGHERFRNESNAWNRTFWSHGNRTNFLNNTRNITHTLSKNTKTQLYTICRASLNTTERNQQLENLYMKVHEAHGHHPRNTSFDFNNSTIMPNMTMMPLNHSLNLTHRASFNGSFNMSNAKFNDKHFKGDWNDQNMSNPKFNDSHFKGDWNDQNMSNPKFNDNHFKGDWNDHRFNASAFDCAQFLNSNGTFAPGFEDVPMQSPNDIGIVSTANSTLGQASVSASQDSLQVASIDQDITSNPGTTFTQQNIATAAPVSASSSSKCSNRRRLSRNRRLLKRF